MTPTMIMFDPSPLSSPCVSVFSRPRSLASACSAALRLRSGPAPLAASCDQPRAGDAGRTRRTSV